MTANLYVVKRDHRVVGFDPNVPVGVSSQRADVDMVTLIVCSNRQRSLGMKVSQLHGYQRIVSASQGAHVVGDPTTTCQLYPARGLTRGYWSITRAHGLVTRSIGSCVIRSHYRSTNAVITVEALLTRLQTLQPLQAVNAQL